MANVKATMTDIRVIIREFSRGTSLREMERKLKLSRTSLRNYRDRAEASGRSMVDLLSLNDAELQAIMLKGDGHRGRDADRYAFMQADLERFIEAQGHHYKLALEEVRSGKKQSHWVWYIFPQMRGLGRSYFAQLYGISDREEAVVYLNHEVLGPRLREITCALLEHDDYSAEEIFGDLDAMKVRSCMTLFDIIRPDDIFADVLNKFYGQQRCGLTVRMLSKV